MSQQECGHGHGHYDGCETCEIEPTEDDGIGAPVDLPSRGDGWDGLADDGHPLYTPAAGDADQYNEHGTPRGYVHPSVG